MLKIIYAEKRRPELSFARFVRRWRYHGGLAMQDAPFWDPLAIYIQNDALRGIDGTDQAYDGVGELIYPALAELEALLASPGLASIVADGDQFFSRVDPIHLVVEQWQLRAGHPGAFKIFVFARAPEGMARADFVARWTDRMEALLHGGGDFDRLACEVNIGAAAADDHAHYDLVADASFASVADGRLGCADWLGAADGDDLFADSVVIAARSYILYDSRYDKGTAAA